ncbi:unnamed protein product [Rhizophagus irregularis]|nr:unnamed protein product [Rhizophagus irregularis]
MTCANFTQLANQLCQFTCSGKYWKRQGTVLGTSGNTRERSGNTGERSETLGNGREKERSWGLRETLGNGLRDFRE